MKKILAFSIISSFVLLSSCTSDTEKATGLLQKSRRALAENRYDDARALIDSLRSTYPKELDIRREALSLADSIELQQANIEAKEADSLLLTKSDELKEMLTHFVYEKDAKYQSVGNFVVPEHAGPKQGLKFFAQVNEEGTMQIVSIDKNRKYHFTEVAVSGHRGTESYLPKDATAKDFEAVNKVYMLARLIADVKSLQERSEKSHVKEQFFETKLMKRK